MTGWRLILLSSSASSEMYYLHGFDTVFSFVGNNNSMHRLIRRLKQKNEYKNEINSPPKIGSDIETDDITHNQKVV